MMPAKSLILFNHLGYSQGGTKKVFLQLDGKTDRAAVRVCDAASMKELFNAVPDGEGAVAGWKGRYFYRFDFAGFRGSGTYVFRAEYGPEILYSRPFAIGADIPGAVALPAIIHYFRSMRSGGVFDRHDRAAPVFGSNQRKDVRGGWYDASGDTSKYFSHLSYANYMNPQQSPMVCWLLADSISALPQRYAALESLVREEAAWGCDFLARMYDSRGFFYMTVFDRWSKDPDQRFLCTYSTRKGVRSGDYQCAFRQGGGAAIAALARAAGFGLEGDFSREQYGRIAADAYAHLREYNSFYCDNGRENIIDEYCALLAASELAALSGQDYYYAEAEYWAKSLCTRQVSDSRYSNFWETEKDIPYFHAAEAGFPVLALFRFLECVPHTRMKPFVVQIIRRAVRFDMEISTETFNPFLYPRQYVSDVDGRKKSGFFYPHNNWSGYWWQGENARIASLSLVFSRCSRLFPDLCADLAGMADAGINWILGANPFDVCMVHGLGRNNVDYQEGSLNFPGGVINGITSGFSDENDIAFLPPESESGDERWRWSEQWIPHAAWLFAALCRQ